MASLGKKIKEIRIANKKSQKEIADITCVDRTLISKIESDKATPSEDFLQLFCKSFNIKVSSLKTYKQKVIIDTSALMKNSELIYKALNKYDEVIIPDIVITELNNIKDKRNKKHSKSNTAWKTMRQINDLKNEEKLKINIKSPISKENDLRIIELAKEIKNKENCEVYIIHDDIGFSTRYERSILLRDFIAEKSDISNYDALETLDKIFLDDWNSYKLPQNINLNILLKDNETILYHTIKNKTKNKYKKLHFIIKNGADPNQTCGKHNLTPLALCIQINDIKSFNILLDYKVDINKASFNDKNTDYTMTKNERNTPLMVAAWHGRMDFIKKLCNYKDLSINQQDANGYTALIKAAIKKNNEIYNFLIKNKADTKIRDRIGRTAKDYYDN